MENPAGSQHEVRCDSGGLAALVATARVAEPATQTVGVPARQACADDVLYTVRVPPAPLAVACAVCGGQLLAAGPTGYADGDPVCDCCLLDNAEQLGMVLALVSVTRSFANLSGETAEEHREALTELGAFARIYEQVAMRVSRPRPFVPLPTVSPQVSPDEPPDETPDA